MVVLDLKPLILPYRDRGRLTLRIENLHQSARLSAGQNNGDRTWSLAQDELEGLSYYPAPGSEDEQTLAIRLIAKDETGASTIALLDVRVNCANDRKDEPAAQLRLARKHGQGDASQDSVLRDEIESLKAALSQRDVELGKAQAIAEQTGVLWQQRSDVAVASAEINWKRAESQRLDALRAELQGQFEHRQIEAERQSRAEAHLSREQDDAVLRQLEKNLAQAQDALSGRESDLNRLRLQMETLQRERDADHVSAKAAAEARSAAELKAATETDRHARLAAALAEVTARSEAAEAALVQAHAAIVSDNRDGERAQHQADVARLRRELDEITAAKEAGEIVSAERLKIEQSQWQQQTARALAEIVARCEAAESSLVTAQTALASDQRDAELTRLRSEMERLRQEAADIVTAKETGEMLAAERFKAEQAQWQQQTARAVAEIAARCETAEAALASAHAAVASDDRDSQMARLQAETARLQSEIARLRQETEELSAAKAAGELVAAEKLKSVQAQWQQQTAKALTELMTRCDSAETALATARAANPGAQNETGQLQQELERLRRDMEAANIARDADERTKAEELKSAQALAQQQATQALAELRARCEAAEAALASTQAQATGANMAESDSYIRGLNREIRTLQATLVDREAALARAQSSINELRFGTSTSNPAANWRPLTSRSRVREESDEDGNSSHLMRDVLVLFAVVMTAILLFPRVEAMLPDDVRWQIETVGGMFGAGNVQTVAPERVVPRAPPKAEHLATITRGVNLRADPSVNGTLVANLKRGAQVTVLETRGNWNRVTVAVPGQAPQQGWVYSSYVQIANDGAKP